MTTLPRYDAVMVILGNRAVDVNGLVARTATFFDDMGEVLTGQQSLSDTQSVVVGRAQAAAIRQFRAGSMSDANLPDNGYDGPVTVIQITLISHDTSAPVPLGTLKQTATHLLSALAVMALPDFVLLPGTRKLVQADALHDTAPRAPAPCPPDPATPDQEQEQTITASYARLSETDLARATEESRLARALRAPCASDENATAAQSQLSARLRRDATPQEMAETIEAEYSARPGARLATWALTGALATISPPVATTVAIVSLAKGEDFRLATQALSVTGLLSMVGASGALAAVTSVLPY